MTARKTLLYLCAGRLHACRWKNGALSPAQCYADDAQGREQFAAFLKTQCNPVHLLTDFVEEDFRIETVPHLRGGEHAALTQRKLEQFYRNTPFRRAVRLQRLQQGRRDDRMLFSALTNPALVSPWLDILLAQHAPLAGIHSVPGVSAALARHVSSEHLLLLSWEKSAGLRQTYFDAGHLYFSRLAIIGSDTSFGAAVATEAARTRQYLQSLGLLLPGQEVDVCILCHVNDQSGLAAHLRDGDGMRYVFLDIGEQGRRIKLKTACADSDATPLLLHLLAAAPPRSHYADAAHTRFFRLRQARRGLYAFSAMLLASGLLCCAADMREANRLDDATRLRNDQASGPSQQARQIIRSLSAASASPADMKAAALLSRALDNYSPQSQAMLGGLSSVMDEYPRIRIDRLSWQTQATESAPAQVISLGGELEQFSGDYREALDYLERFRRALTQRGYEVQTQTLPLDISPQGNIGKDAGGDRRAPFSLRLVRRQTT
jgi:hypothetical protein